MRILLAALVTLLLGHTAAAADELRPGYIALDQRDDSHWDMSVMTPLQEFGIGRPVSPIIPENCRATGGGRPVYTGGSASVKTALECAGPLKGHRVAVPDLAGSSEVFVRVAPLGESERVYRITPSAMAVTISGQSPVGGTVLDYLEMGIEHILQGWDHLLFVIALVLLVGRTGPIVKAVTAFTVAHSLTLIATTLDVVRLPSKPVEALIALSIILIAVEVVKSDRNEQSLSQRVPWVVAFLFGLVHGFGFAGALHEIGLPANDVPLMLVSFNIGIEIGQLLIIGGVIAVRGVIGRLAPTMLRPSTLAASYAIGITSSYWLIDRL